MFSHVPGPFVTNSGFMRFKAKMMVYARALVAATKAAQADGNAGPLQAALDDALAAGMEPKCAAAAKARKVLRKLQKQEAAAAAAAAQKAEEEKAAAKAAEEAREAERVAKEEAAKAAAAAKKKAKDDAAAAKVRFVLNNFLARILLICH